MKKSLTLSMYFLVLHVVVGQEIDDRKVRFDSLYYELSMATNDSSRVNIYNSLSSMHKFSRPDSGIYYGNRALALARIIGYSEAELNVMQYIILSYETIGDHSKSARIASELLKLSRQRNDVFSEAQALLGLGRVNYILGNYAQSITQNKTARSIFEKNDLQQFVAITNSILAQTFIAANEMDSAFYYGLLAKDLGEKVNLNWVTHVVYGVLGDVYNAVDNTDSAYFYFKKSYIYSGNNASANSEVGRKISRLFLHSGNMDSSRYYANHALRVALENNLYPEIISASMLLTELYEENDVLKALNYNKLALAYTDSLSEMAEMTAFSDFADYDEQQRIYELENAQKEYKSQLRTNIFLGSTFTLLVIAFFLYRNNRQKKKANALLKEQKEEVQSTLEKLESTQSQLIQSEKMASLGELTAGIAHEIQNPLNFVNNFSDVNTELIDELKEAIQQGDLKEVEDIANDLKDNEEKITHHGKRAEEIVRSMLQHSRGSDGKKEPTDINALCDEYLRLAYHGLRAKDQSFNAEFELKLDESIPKIEVVPQDIGRVLLNLINNAFQAVSERRISAVDEDYKPLVVVSTKLISPSGGGKGEECVQISVSDNGPGIPDDIKDKIFQPFFTTKPTGQGTGLGLSMSYDIVKVHGGTIEVVSTDGGGTVFTIKLNN